VAVAASDIYREWYMYLQLLSPTATPISATDADAKIDILDD